MDDSLIPPTALRLLVGPFADESFYRSTARDFVQTLLTLGGLRPTDRILDIGCGCGRVAAALTDHLDATGGYDGMDVIPALVEWSHTNITPKFQNFRFHLVDVASRAYNPVGRLQASQVRFPFPDGTFDFAIACSLYTHMLHEDAENYLRETHRVLKRGGTLLASFFLLYPESIKAIAKKQTIFRFRHRFGPCRASDSLKPEKEVAYDEDYVLDLMDRLGFRLDQPVQHGSWSTTKSPLITQDYIAARRAT
jgi:SAM-dependent methyltransferase